MIHTATSIDMLDLAALEPTRNSMSDEATTGRRWQLVMDKEQRMYVYSTADDARTVAAALIALADRLEELDATHQPDPMEDQ